MSFDFESKEYLDYTTNGISGKLTRGLVVSTKDPLYSGRVKVWIPTLHGGAFEETDVTGDIPQEDSLLGESVGTDVLGKLSETAINCLPWAPVVGHNWGPTSSNFSNDFASSFFGVFNVPKVGTEVYIIFEDDNPNLPLVLGAVFHESELLQNARIKSIELSPGILLSAELTTEQERDNYENRVAESYIVQSEKGAHLILTDLDGQEQISLGSSLNPLKKAVILDDGSPNSKYTAFLNEFPNFPTTASAPYRKRQSVNTDNPVLDLQVLRSKPTNTSSISGMPVTPSMSATGPNAASTTIAVSSSTSVKKVPPITIAWPKIVKGSYKDFKTDRTVPGGPKRIHLGVDLSVTKAKLVAPIDCIPLAYINSPTAGKMLLVKGIDGYCHAFLHLDSVLPEIIQDTNNGIYKKYTVGSPLGVTGNTGKVEGAGGGWHLHWEVFHAGDLVKTGADIIKLREILRKPGQGTMKGITIKGENFSFPYNLIHPLEEWLKQDTLTDASGNPIVTEVSMNVAQLESFSEVYNSAVTEEYNKVIGLDISLTPGGESIFMRHSSGGFAGFDADGNWKVYTPGNAEYKVNRSLVFDVLGGVITNCLAIYSRAKTIIRLMSTISPRFTSNIGNPSASNTDLPKAFARIESARAKDMADALKQSSANAYYSLEDSTLGKTIADIKKDGYASEFDPTKYPEKFYDKADFDTLIKIAHSTYIPQNHPLAKVLTPALIKSIMLKESNGDPTARNKSHIGLFQLSVGAIEDITKDSNVNLEAYADPKLNIDIGVQYLLLCVNIMVTLVNKNKLTISNDPNQPDMKSVLMAALMGYNFGPYAIKNLYANVLNQSNTLSYAALEERFINDNLYTRDKIKGKETLDYAPHIMYISARVKI
jgi:hypothetical protein